MPGVKLIWKYKWRALLLLIVVVAGCFAFTARYFASSGNDLNAEIEWVRSLARSGDTIALAAALDQSVIRIPAGEFVMGSNNGRSDERPEHSVYLDAFEVEPFPAGQFMV